MVNASREFVAIMDTALSAARTSLVNSGQDTEVTFSDGSTLILKGVTQVEAVFATRNSSGGSGAARAPVGGEIGENGERAHHRRNGREGAHRVGE